MEYLVGALVVIIIAMIGVIYFLIIRRKYTIKNVPEDLNNYLQSLGENINEHNGNTVNSLEKFDSRIQEYTKSTTDGLSQYGNRMISTIDNHTKQSSNDLSEYGNKITTKLDKYINATADELSQYGDRITSNIANNELTLTKTVGTLKNNIGNMNEELVEIKNQLNALQQYTIEKDKKIRRFEDGYDAKIQNKFIKEIIDVIEFMRKQNLKEPNDVIDESIEDLLLMLDSNGVHTLKIEVNENYAGNENIAKVERVEMTDNPELDNKVKIMTKYGYFLSIDEDTQKVIKPASVIVYKLEIKE